MTNTIPRDWSELDLGTIAVILDTLRIPLSSVQRAERSGRYPYCGANGVLDYIDDFRIDDDVILLAEDGGNFDQFGQRPIAYRMRGKIWVNNHAHVLKAANGQTSFLFYALEHKDIRPYISSGTRSKLTRSELVRIKVAVPDSRDEQRCIASSIEAVDYFIASLERLITKKQAIKQGMMQELLTGRTRLPGFDGSWSTVELGDLTEIVSGGTPSSSVKAYWDGGIPWATPTDITNESGRYLKRTERTISKGGLEHSAARLLPVGSLLLCTRATVGEVKIAAVPTATNQGFKSLVPNSGVSSTFLYYKVLTLKDMLTSKGSGSTFLEVSKRDVAKLLLEIPNTSEQIAIATALTDADDEIDCLTVRLQKARAIKQGMMQELLTGRTRLPVQEAVS